MTNKTTVHIINPVNCTQEFYADIANRFRPIHITANSTIQEIMFSAGQQHIIDYISTRVQNSVLSGNPTDLIKPASFIKKFTNKLRRIDVKGNPVR